MAAKKSGTQRPAQNHKKRTPSRRPAAKSAQPSPRIWLGAGLVITVFAIGIIYLDKFNSNNPSALIHQVLQHQHVPVAANNDPDFEFYTALPSGKLTLMTDNQTTVPVTVSPHKVAVVQSKTTPVNTTDKANYFLQIAAFANATDADKLKAQLLLDDFNANTTQFAANGKTWFRVVVGPYHDLKDFNQAQTQLNTLHFQTMRLQLE